MSIDAYASIREHLHVGSYSYDNIIESHLLLCICIHSRPLNDETNSFALFLKVTQILRSCKDVFYEVIEFDC